MVAVIVSRPHLLPLPFSSIRRMTGGNEGPYVIGAMFTTGYAQKAERLAMSCEKFGLPYTIHEVPEVHRSINGRLGTGNLSFTKPNFIHHLLEAHKKPVLYLDADCEVVSEPRLIDDLVKSSCDFAIYNWLADDYNDRFNPIEVRSPSDDRPVRDRFFAFGGTLGSFEGYFTTKQLLCSGLVQLYRDSDAARSLLADWHQAIAEFPGSADDECLGFAFNNRSEPSRDLKVQWLPKSYARYRWWIYVEPIINHRDHPQWDSGFVPINDPGGRKPFYPSLAQRKEMVLRFPRDCIIDTQTHLLCRLEGTQLVPVQRTDAEFWL